MHYSRISGYLVPTDSYLIQDKLLMRTCVGTAKSEQKKEHQINRSPRCVHQ